MQMKAGSVELKACPEMGAPEGMTGYVKVRRPMIHERFRAMKEAGYTVDEAGSVQPVADKLEGLEKMMLVAQPFVEEVKLQFADGEEITDPAEIFCHPDLARIAMHIASQVMQGFRPSKN